MPEKGVISGCVMVIAMLSLGTFLIMKSMTPLERKDVVLNDTFSVAAHKYENRTAWVDSSGEYFASFTVSEGTIRSSLMVGEIFSLWTEGKYEPDWIESDQGDYGTGISMGNEGVTIYFVFFNNDTFTKQVHLEASRAWQETDYIDLYGGIVLVLSGTATGVVLVYRQKSFRANFE